MYKIVFIILLILTNLLTSCISDDTNNSATIIETNIFLKKNYLSIDGTDEKPIYYYKKISNFSEKFPDLEFKKIENNFLGYHDINIQLICNSVLYLSAIDDNGIYNILSYDFINNTTTILLKAEKDSIVYLSFVNQNYIVWKEDKNANWLKVSLHLLNIKDKSDRVIYIYKVDENGLNKFWNFNNIVIYKNEIYFDEISDIVNDIYEINLYKYKMKNNKLVLFSGMGKSPMIYKEFSWLGYNSDNMLTSIKKTSIKKEKEIAYINGDFVVGKLESSKNNIAITDGITDADYDYLLTGDPKYLSDTPYEDPNRNENAHISRSAYGLLYYDGIKSNPLIASSIFHGDAKCGDDFILWYQDYISNPYYFNIKDDEIIKIDIIDEDIYCAFQSEKYLLFISNLSKYENKNNQETFYFYYIEKEKVF